MNVETKLFGVECVFLHYYQLLYVVQQPQTLKGGNSNWFKRLIGQATAISKISNRLSKNRHRIQKEPQDPENGHGPYSLATNPQMEGICGQTDGF